MSKLVVISLEKISWYYFILSYFFVYIRGEKIAHVMGFVNLLTLVLWIKIHISNIFLKAIVEPVKVPWKHIFGLVIPLVVDGCEKHFGPMVSNIRCLVQHTDL